ncbi:hypothetical protein PUR59_30590 [Streptomyces sp. SP18ES09]|uniref:hypothetical protein n=1 Tax=Streptomyces sp. SP18ES09 TaxID=3002532 RepID=UPI002E789856|nr:hypothetical protein [Streptomyces sp. SP18ES09]MEE1819350.1 hypothetical protein [Streptomyces sp. SP18ES09]
MTAADIARLDVPLADVEQQIAVLRDSQLRHAALGNEHEVVADGDAIYLLRHPELCSTDADYPGWTPGGSR